MPREEPPNEARAAIMLARGAPVEYANDIESWALRGQFKGQEKNPSLKQHLSGLAVLAVATIVFLVPYFNLANMARHEALEVANEAGAVGYHISVGNGLLLVALAIGLAAGIGYLLAEDAYLARVRAARSFWDPFGLPGFYARPIAERTRKGSEDAAHFLRRFRQMDIAIRTGALAVLFFAALVSGIVLSLREVNTFFVAGPAGVIEQRDEGSRVRTTYPIGDVLNVETNCLRPRRGSYRMIVKASFRGGRTFDVGDTTPIPGYDPLPALEEISAAIPGSAIRAKRADLWDRINGCTSKYGHGLERGTRRVIALLDPDPPPEWR